MAMIFNCNYCHIHYVGDKPPPADWKRLSDLKEGGEKGWACPECCKHPPCNYESSECCGPVGIVVHDKRGCVTVCAHHAVWRTTTSRMGGHAKDCPESVFADVRPPFSLPMFTRITR